MKKFAFVLSCISFVLAATSCSDDGGGTKDPVPVDPLANYNEAATSAAQAECSCYAPEFGFTDPSSCFDQRFSPLVLSSCEAEAVRCESGNFDNVMSCKVAAQRDFEGCLQGCPADPLECRDGLDTALLACDDLRSDALLAHFETCRAGGSPICSDPQFPDVDAGSEDAGAEDAGAEDASMPDDGGASENRAPSANAGADKSIARGGTATLNGSGTDPDGDALSYSWAIIDQPATSDPALSDANQATATLTAGVPGVYTVELTVDDGSLDDTDQMIVTVESGEAPPIAAANAPGTAGIGDTVNLDGSNSSDAVDSLNELDFTWVFTADPSAGTDVISNPNSYIASFVPSVGGTYELRLTVTDTAGNTDTADVSVFVYSGPCVIISEYVEAAGQNKAIEVYNCGASVVDLTRIGYCGEANGESIAVDGCTGDVVMTGTLAPTDVYVLCSSGFSSSALCDQMYNQVSFNGDDRVVIYYDDDDNGSYTDGTDSILDVFGRLGQRPTDPNLWSDKILRRCNFTPFDGMSAFDWMDYYNEVAPTAFGDIGVRPTETCAP